LPHQGIHFTLRHNGRDILDYPRVQSRKERLFAFLGKKSWENMRPLPTLSPSSTSEGIEIEGYLSIPTETRNRADQVFFFVNDRYVQNRMLLSAMMDAYRRLLHPGRYPTAVVFLYIDPATIDINVHPKKQEIKFSDEQRIWRTLHATVREALSGIEREALGFGPEEDFSFAPPQQVQPGEQQPRQDHRVPPPAPAPAIPQSRRAEQTEEIKQAVDHFFEKRGQEKLKAETHQQLFSPSEKPVPLAQVLDTYLLCEQEGRLVIVDQHAAAERIRYEQLKNQMTHGAPRQQALLFPVTVDVPAGDVPRMEENLSLFETLGFDIQHFGGETFVVNSMPAIHKMEECESLVLDLLKDLTSIGNSTTMDEIKQRLLVSMACHRSIRAGDRLGPEAMQDLIDQLYQAEHPFTCPHGRPTMVALDRSALEKFFKRSGF
jgi:DNA mismatch repair protein MutL